MLKEALRRVLSCALAASLAAMMTPCMAVAEAIDTGSDQTQAGQSDNFGGATPQLALLM